MSHPSSTLETSTVRKGSDVGAWEQVEAEAGELAAQARAMFDAHTHKVLATLRSDGGPRLSGIEVRFADGQVWLGMMWQSVKARDLQRDPRLALHSATVDPDGADGWTGDAKLSGRAVEVVDDETTRRVSGEPPPGPSHLFRVDVTELVTVRVGQPADHLVITSWHEGRGLDRIERR